MVTAAHNACIQELLQEVNVHGKPDRHMRLLTIETESRFGTLWDQEDCNQFGSKEELLEAARDEEMKIPWRAANEGPPVPEEQYRCHQHTPVVSMLLAHTSSHSPVLLWRCSAYNGPAS